MSPALSITEITNAENGTHIITLSGNGFWNEYSALFDEAQSRATKLRNAGGSCMVMVINCHVRENTTRIPSRRIIVSVD